FQTANPVQFTSIRELAVSSVQGTKSVNSTAFRFTAGFVKSMFDHVLINGAGAIPNSTMTATFAGSGFDLGAVTDSVEVRECLLWFILGTGIKIGRGSEVRVSNGRVIGNGATSGR